MRSSIPFTKPYFGKTEERALLSVFRSGKVGGNGYYCQLLEKEFCSQFGSRYAIAVNSCTSSLELACAVIGIRSGDKVICPSFSFVSTASAIVRQGGKPVFVDIVPDTFNIDPALIEKAVSKRTRAIIVVHYAGVACEMDKIMDIAKRRNLVVIEDAAHAIGAKFKNRFLGTIGDIGCFSFHETKNIVCGEGGLFVTRHARFAKCAEIFCEKGTNRLSFLKGEVKKYTWVGEGSSFVLSDLLVLCP